MSEPTPVRIVIGRHNHSFSAGFEWTCGAATAIGAMLLLAHGLRWLFA